MCNSDKEIIIKIICIGITPAQNVEGVSPGAAVPVVHLLHLIDQ
jgi:hypothetical protein